MRDLFALRTVGLTGAALAVQATITMASLIFAMLAADPRSGFDVSRSIVGLYTSSVYFGAATGAMFAGGFVARYGPIRISQFSLLSSCVGLVALSFGSIWLALIFAVFIGLGYGPANPAASELLGRHTPKEYRPLIFSFKQRECRSVQARPVSRCLSCWATWTDNRAFLPSPRSLPC